MLGLLIWRGVRVLIHSEGEPTEQTKEKVRKIVNDPDSIRNLYFAYKDAVILLSEDHKPIPTKTGGRTHLIPDSAGRFLIEIADGLSGFIPHEEFLEKASQIEFNPSILTKRERPFAPSLIFPNHPDPWDRAFKLLEMRARLGMPVRFIHLKDDDYLLVYRGENVIPHEEFFDLENKERFQNLGDSKVVGCTRKACYIVDVENVLVKESEIFIPEDIQMIDSEENDTYINDVYMKIGFKKVESESEEP